MKKTIYKYRNLLVFIFSFIVMAIYLWPNPDMLMGGGDVTSIWETIKTFYSDNITSSYVLYKGFLSIYPYVWLYKLALIFNLNSFIFIKIYYCLLFAYATSIGMPAILEFMFKKKCSIIKRLLLSIILFMVWRYTTALFCMTVDLPTLTFFIGSLHLVILFINKPKAKNVYKLLLAGLLSGITSCFSGQYYVSAILVVIILAIVIFDKKQLLNITFYKKAFLMVMVLICFVAPKAYNSHFEKKIVEPMRQSGEWLPTGNDWLNYGIGNLKQYYRIFIGVSIPSNRAKAIMEQDKGVLYADSLKKITAGGTVYTKNEAFKLYLKHPVDMITSWAQCAFLSISLDNGNQSVFYLFISYTSLFACIYILKKKLVKLKQLLNIRTILCLAFIMSIAAPIALHIEMRYCLAIHSLMFGCALYAIPDIKMKSITNLFKNISHKESKKNTIDKKEAIAFPHTVFYYLIFILMCFMIYAALLETTGSNPSSILFRL